MPYIKQERRQDLREYDYSTLPQNAGELNYVIARLVDRMLGNTPNYDDINSVIGALECCKQEVYFRVARTLEDRKILSNGDVFRERV